MEAIETLVVSKVNNFGIRVGDKQYNYSKAYKGQKLQVGQMVTAKVYTSATGAKYINSVETIAQATVEAVKEVPQQSKGRDFEKEALGKTRCALLEALLSNPNVVSDLSNLNVEALYQLVDSSVDYVFGRVTK